jgi:hypothetical protein
MEKALLQQVVWSEVNTTGDLQGENWQQVIYYTLVALSMEVLLIYIPIEPNVVVLVGYVIVSNHQMDLFLSRYLLFRH